MTIAVTMCKLFVTLALGYVLTKKGMLDEHTGKKLSALIVNVCMPLLVISSVAGVEGERGEVLALFLTGVLFYCLLPLLGLGIARLIRVPANLRGTYMCMVMFANCSFMGFPVISALLGESSIFYSNIFHMGFYLSFFSLGLFLLRRDAGKSGASNAGVRAAKGSGAGEALPSEKTDPSGNGAGEALLPEKTDPSGSAGSRRQAVRQILNNGVIASVLAVVIYFAGIPLPAVVTETAGFLGNVSMPLSMLVIGSSIAGYSFREILSRRKVFLITPVRLVLLPVLAYFAIQLFTDNEMFVKIVTITLGMPVASLVAMGSAPYKEQGEEASIGVVFTTLCSLVTIPVMILLLGA